VHKFYTDPYFLNSDICRIGGVTLQALNSLEEDFLDIIDFNLVIDEAEYEQYLNGLKIFFNSPLSAETVSVIEDIKLAMVKMEQQEHSQRLMMSGSGSHPSTQGSNSQLLLQQ